MQQRFYHNIESEGSKDLILFLNGWAMTPEMLEHLLLPEACDLLICWDYRSLALDFDFSPYHKIYLGAWSMGVWAAEQLAKKGVLPSLATATAVCGTAYPMDDEMGIPLAIFKGTYKGLNEANRAKFNRRICGGKSLRRVFDSLASRPTDEIKDELWQVMQSEELRLQGDDLYLPTSLNWDRAYIGMKDLIIPGANQIRFWAQRAAEQILLPEAAHYIFNDYEKWEELLKIEG